MPNEDELRIPRAMRDIEAALLSTTGKMNFGSAPSVEARTQLASAYASLVLALEVAKLRETLSADLRAIASNTMFK